MNNLYFIHYFNGVPALCELRKSFCKYAALVKNIIVYKENRIITAQKKKTKNVQLNGQS